MEYTKTNKSENLLIIHYTIYIGKFDCTNKYNFMLNVQDIMAIFAYKSKAEVKTYINGKVCHDRKLFSINADTYS